MNHWSPAEWIVLLFSVSICAVLLISIINSTFGSNPLPAKKAKMLETIILSMVTVINIFVGAWLNQRSLLMPAPASECAAVHGAPGPTTGSTVILTSAHLVDPSLDPD